LISGSANFSSSFIKKSTTVPEELCTSTLQREPSGHTAFWIAIVIFAFVGILGLAEGFRRYKCRDLLLVRMM